MADNTLTKSGALFSPKQVADVFSKVTGKSSIAKLSAQTPIPFSGVDSYVFTMDGEAALVGEGAAKPAGSAEIKKVSVKPVKVLYQHRVTDEFKKMSDEARLPYLQLFTEGFAAKIARAMDLIYFHGVNPKDGAVSTLVSGDSFVTKVTQIVDYVEATPDVNVEDAIELIEATDGNPTGIVMSPEFKRAVGKMRDESGSNRPLYEGFQGVACPDEFIGLTADKNNTVSKTVKGDTKIRAIVGDFQNALKWGYTSDIMMEMIEFGDPDGKGDLKQSNEIVLRAEAYIGCGILDPESFALIKVKTTTGS